MVIISTPYQEHKEMNTLSKSLVGLPETNLRVCGLQVGLFSSSVNENLKKLVSAFESIKVNSVDLVIAPEVSSTYYNYNTIKNLKEGEEVLFLETLQALCCSKKCALVVGLAVRHGELLKNRAYFINENGEIKAYYDKMHLISLMGETDYFHPGNTITVVNVRDWRVGIAICFDLRFAELFLNYALDGCHLIVLPACWPSERRNHWRNLHLARAQECQCFFAGVNMGGVSPDGKIYGGSIVSSPDSVPVAELGWGEEGTIFANLDPEEIARQKELFDLMKNRPRPPLLP